jgi:sugar O-acyltransferase (sialic acid O-acetyltransferase NeuD family)
MKKVIVFGANDLAQMVAFYLRCDSNRTPAAFCVDAAHLRDTTLDWLPVVAFEEVEKDFPSKDYEFIVPLYDNRLRERKAAEVEEKGYQLTSYYSTKATIWTTLGRNCVVMENNVIQPFVKVGDNCIFWSGNHIGHHSVIEGSVFFSSHVVLSGHCRVDKYAWFGVNSAVRDGLKIAEGTFVCMGADVTENTNSYKKYFGSPAKEIGNVD